MLLDKDKGIRFIEALDNTEAYLIYFENNTMNKIESSGFFYHLEDR